MPRVLGEPCQDESAVAAGPADDLFAVTEFDPAERLYLTEVHVVKLPGHAERDLPGADHQDPDLGGQHVDVGGLRGHQVRSFPARLFP